MKILVTGANGQLGQCFSDLAKKTDWQWVFATRKDFDLTDAGATKTFIEINKPDVIVNTAAYTQVDKAEIEIDSAFKVNQKGIENLMSAVANTTIKIIHISTDYVFDGQGSIPFEETDPVMPNSVYGKSKAAGEQILLDGLKERSYIIRTSWLYSEYGHNFVKTMIRLGTEKNEIKVVNDQWGNPTYAHDLAMGIIAVLAHIEMSNAATGIYHFANKNSTSWFHFATEIMKLAGLKCEVFPIPTDQFPTPAKRPHFSALNSRKFESNFNFAIRNWKVALQDCLNKINSDNQ